MAALGYERCQVYHEIFTAFGYSSHFVMVLFIWVLSGFLSILIHELGHSLAFRVFGVSSHIVLYQWGGMAIPGAGLLWSRQGSRVRLTHLQKLIVSAAGPVLQLLLAAIVAAIGWGVGFRISEVDWVLSWFDFDSPPGRIPPNVYLYAFMQFLVFSSVWWAVLNLVPILPLDGGHIARHLIAIIGKRDGEYEAAWVSIVAACLVAYYFAQNSMGMNAFFFVALAYTNYQFVQSRGRHYW
jgi:stage IV sporulation protein FB